MVTSASVLTYFCLVLSAAVQWLEHERTTFLEQTAAFERQAEEQREATQAGRTEPPTRVANSPPPVTKPKRSPQNVLLAVSIVARCVLRVIEKAVVVPEPLWNSFMLLCKRVDVTTLLQPLPWAGDLTTDPKLSKNLMAGLNTLLRPLMRLSESRNLAEATRPWADETPLRLEVALNLIRDDFVQALVDGYKSAQTGLPDEDFPQLPEWENGDVHAKLVELENTFRVHFRGGSEGLPFETNAT